ncbi:hypothetical protein CV093_14865 [Oceanobacillus sp. 143]|uniref:YtkA-like domain-containing protein n=1 Tax=Oceanobacillus zhaokaii TaxID=2052660 RepID=A0A345PIZ2_9BACI|nr:FixH family protein [Oceanobacillus zhaokaii]AXI09972.1 hypothetical protein CUC15_14020 [Oceanobacillus zhaokaii]QGS69159.1 hypothetical protein CV093_14865 [Oceanobacillus sp. 143]
MRRFAIFFAILIVAALSACGAKEDSTNADSEEIVPLEVEFSVPETAEVDEEVKLIATVTYGEESVAEADDVTFEIWEQGMEDKSNKYEATNNGDGTYTMETSFDHDGIYEMFAHVTAKDMHTMPKKSITVGSSPSHDSDHEQTHTHEQGEVTDGFAMHFMEPKSLRAAEETPLKVHVQLDNQPLEQASIRFEIWNEETPDKHEWVNAREAAAGEYFGDFVFQEAGTYQLAVHVENEDGLHEHQEFEINVTK